MTLIVTVFCLVYLGMMLGNLPGLALDRTGIALLAAITLIVFVPFKQDQLVQAIDWPVLAILFGLMIIAAQLYFSGFHTLLIKKIEKLELKPSSFLMIVIFTSGILSAALINDIVVLALAPLFIKICFSKGWRPEPILLGLAASSNVGSAMTLIGNPQNILISQALNMSFSAYFLDALVPGLLGLFWVWLVLCYQTKNNWKRVEEHRVKIEHIDFHAWRGIKGLIVLTTVLVLFFISPLPRYQIALAAAGLLLLSRKMASRTVLSLIDWQLFILFMGLFITNYAFQMTGIPESFIHWLQVNNIDLTQPGILYTITVFLSNIVSNVPAIMLLLPFSHDSFAGTILAQASTLGGNLLITGSIATLIVASKASDENIRFNWKMHFKAGLPITLGTIALSALWLYFRHRV